MKKIFTIALMAIGLYAKGQVVLEHSYSSNWQMEVVNIEGDGYKYLGVDTTTKDIKIYNTDHSLWKTINTNIPQSAVIYSLSSYCSKYLFNADNKLEVMVMYYVTSPSVSYVAELYNEDGVILNTFNNASSYTIAQVNSGWKLLVRFGTSPQHTEVYSLPGQWAGTSSLGKPSLPNKIFPNPIENTATIHYTLPNAASQGILNIYNGAGINVRSYTVTGQFNDLVIDKGSLPPGIYIYDISTANGRQAGQRFVIQ